ncbi:hypothetical protein DEO72_LG10g2523 [Vigna unguiculata]|uniref:Uncharacterized protein n=1 Tax=Vigna unguiculata TaxID=3917 RepID=A0A4D6NBL9_VIGUN|nr:hypothetical protein DEO72_LG10g2523 [Vigna unguiculata]
MVTCTEVMCSKFFLAKLKQTWREKSVREIGRQKVGGSGDTVSKSEERRKQREKVRGKAATADDSGGDRIQWKRVDGNDNQPTGSRSATPF